MKRFGIPSYLLDYNSVWNPLLPMGVTVSAVCKNDKKGGIFRDPIRTTGGRGKSGMIDKAVLEKYGARSLECKKDDYIFYEGDEALYYFQIQEGSVKMITNSSQGQEFIQGIFGPNTSFGEPPLLSGFNYPSGAVALEPTVLMRLPKERFLQLLKENFDIHLKLDQVLCQRLKYKSLVLSEISFSDPEHRIITLLNYLKKEGGSRAEKNKSTIYQVPFTRQQIADMTGLRVETVIRAVKKLEDEGKLKIVGHKIQL
jgi:CRP-like cAMP-binding protein